MKISKIIRLRNASFILALFMSVTVVAQEFEVEDYRMLYNFRTLKQQDNSRLLEVKFIARNKKNKKDKLPVYEAKINFINLLNEKEILLGTSKTNNDGIAQLILPENQKYQSDSNGNINIIARFDGTASLNEIQKKISIKNIDLKLKLIERDSIKTVLVTAFTSDSTGVKSPAQGVDISIAIKSMFSKMIIEEGTLMNGEFEYKLTEEFPGDVNGNLTIYSMIEDHDVFGNVIQEETKNWGSSDNIDIKEKNKLWTSAAPIWMYVVLIIMLAGVWINYLYTIVKLFEIKNEAKNLDYYPEY